MPLRATHCNNTLQNTLQQHTATTHCNTSCGYRELNILPTSYATAHNTYQHTATHCNNTLQQHTATTHCNNTLQQRAATTHCNTGRGYKEYWVVSPPTPKSCHTNQHTLQHTATHCTTHCNTGCSSRESKESSPPTPKSCHTNQHTLQHTTTHCNNTLHHMLQLQGVQRILAAYAKFMSHISTHTATHCTNQHTLQHTATHCSNTLQQHTATTHCNKGCGYRE